MIKIEHPVFASPEQMMFIIEGMRNPKASWHLSDSYIDHDVVYDKDRNVEIWHPKFCMGEKDFELMKRLALAGKDHRKTLRMIPVFLRMTTNHTVWAEIDTYKVGTIRNSCSKMHTIHKNKFTEDMFSNEGMKEMETYVRGVESFDLDDKALVSSLKRNQLETLIILNELIDKFNSSDDQEKRKSYWRTIIDRLPIGFNLTANMALNYEVLLNMYFSRKGHKMLEWREFCQWMLDNVPYFKDLVEYITKEKRTMSKGIKFELVGEKERVKSLEELLELWQLWRSREEFESAIANANTKMPTRATKGSAGYDCFSPISFTLKPGEEIKIPTFLKAKMPRNVFLAVYPRSGLGFKYYTRLANTVGIIDSDYYGNESNEGHIFVKIRNEGKKNLAVRKGDAVCQFVFQQYLTTEDDLVNEERTGGFGSTDKRQ